MRSPLSSIRRLVSSLVAAAVFSATTLRAQEAPASAPPARVPQTNAIVLLINRLAERGTITKQDAAELIAQADADAADARVQVAEAQLAAAKADAALARSQAAMAAANFAASQASNAEVAATRSNAAQVAAARALLGMPAAAAAAPRPAPLSDDLPVAQPQAEPAPMAAAMPAPAPVATAPAPEQAAAPAPSVAASESGELAPPSAALMAPADALAAEAQAPHAAPVQPQADPAENTAPSSADPQPPVNSGKPAQYADGESTPSPSTSDGPATASAPAQSPSSDSGAADQSGNGAPAVRVSDVLGDTPLPQSSAPAPGNPSENGPATRVDDTLGDSTPAKPIQEDDEGASTTPSDSQATAVAPGQDEGSSTGAVAPASAAIAPVAAPQQQADASTAPSAPPSPEAPPEDGTVSVAYVPEVVRTQIAQEVKDEVIAQAHQEGWGTATPDWVTRISLYGDIRVRFEDIINHSTNTPGGFINFNAINTGSPFDIGKNATTLPPELDVDQNRQRERLRARLGAAVDLKDGFTAGFRLATGNDNNPVTENQTFGGANSAQGGDFSKYAVWLDRGYIKYQSPGDPDTSFSVTVGRFGNPFLSTTMLWANDLGFDGAVLKIPFKLNSGDEDDDAVRPFLVAGIFPVFNTDLNFGSNQPAKFASYNKWLEAAQAGLKWKEGSDFTLTSAVALYYYKNIEGQLSPPVMIQTSADIGPTDDSRPSFAQNGNTYMVLRDIDTPPTAANDNNTIGQFQYFGLATPFHDLVLTQKIDFLHDAPFGVSLIGEYVKNLAFNQQSVGALAVNNLGTPSSGGGTGPYAGGNTGWLVNLSLGDLLMDRAGDWSFGIGYRRVESDSVVDAFTDADFGGILTGTNLQGYTLSASYALAHGIWLEGHWYSASAIAGATYKNDTVQIDLNAKF